ncbi:hypothetical protein glysoja_045752, partial [Glycine soja]
LKNKLRNLKITIKQWSKVNSDVNVSKIHSLRQQLNELETTAGNRPLSQDEVKLKKSFQQKLWEVSNAYESLLRQKSRERWIKEGDSNTAYFHKVLNCRRNYNAIQGLFIDGNWVQQPDRVKDEVLNFFLHRFTEDKSFRPTLDGVFFQSIDQNQREGLIAPFSDQEIKEAVWSCGGDKCPG